MGIQIEWNTTEQGCHTGTTAREVPCDARIQGFSIDQSLRLGVGIKDYSPFSLRAWLEIKTRLEKVSAEYGTL